MLHSYSYVATLPLLVLFSVAMTALKFKEGMRLPFHDARSHLTRSRICQGANRRKFVLTSLNVQKYSITSHHSVIPRPLIFWAPNNKNLLLPLYFILSIAWSLELYDFYSLSDQQRVSFFFVRVTHLEGIHWRSIIVIRCSCDDY